VVLEASQRSVIAIRNGSRSMDGRGMMSGRPLVVACDVADKDDKYAARFDLLCTD
jgi:hypothetical protein